MSDSDVPTITERRAIATTKAPAAIGPYSQAVECGNLVFVSGQIPLDPATGAIVGDNAPAQAEQVMQNLAAILGAAGLSFRHVVKTTIYLTNLGEFAAVNAVYAAYVPDPPPARATIEVARLPRDVQVEIDVIAAR